MGHKNNNKETILIVSDAWHPQVNGVVRTYEHICAQLSQRGHDVHVIGPNSFRFRTKMPGYKEIELTLFPYRRLAKLIKSINPAILHIATEGPLGWAARRYCKKHSLPFSTCYHTQFPDYTAARIAKHLPFLYDFVHRRGVAYLKRFHAPSAAIMVATPTLDEQLKSWGFTTPLKRLTRGVNTEHFCPADESSKSKTPYKNQKQPIALYVGRVAIEKNIETFLEMPWDGSKVVVGDGPSLKTLKTKYPDTTFAGKKVGPALAAYYQHADIFVFPSKTDTFGMVLIEAMACGLPIAGYDVMGPRDIVTEEFLGTTDATDLSLSANKALEHTEKHNKKELREKRYSHVKEHYSWPRVADQFLAISRETLND